MPQAKKPEVLTEELGRLLQIQELYKKIVSVYCVADLGHYFDAFGVEQKELMENAVYKLLEKQKGVNYVSLLSNPESGEYGSHFIAVSLDAVLSHMDIMRNMKLGVESLAIPLHTPDMKEKSIETKEGIVVVDPSKVKISAGASSYVGESPNPVNLLKTALEASKEAKRHPDGMFMLNTH